MKLPDEVYRLKWQPSDFYGRAAMIITEDNRILAGWGWYLDWDEAKAICNAHNDSLKYSAEPHTLPGIGPLTKEPITILPSD